MEVLRTQSSTIIYEVAYEAETRILRVRFHRGGTPRPGYYEYEDVPPEVFETLRRIEELARAKTRWYEKGQKPYSVGTFYHRGIKGLFPERRMRDGQSEKPPASTKKKSEKSDPARPRRPRRVLH